MLPLGPGATPEASVFVVILNYNGWRDTLECLRSLEHLDYRNYKVIVVDNASGDGSEARIREACPRLTMIQTGKNLGMAGGNNVGIRYALEHGADYIWLLNNDTVVEPEALTYLLRRMRARPDAGMCGSTLIYYHDRNTLQALGGARYNRWLGTSWHLGQNWPIHKALTAEEVERKLDYLVAASLLVSREFLENIGLMSEEYFLYFEEIDWATRARGRYKLAFAPRSVVYHKEGASIGGNNQKPTEKSRTADYYALRNRILFTRKFYPWALPTVYFGLLVAILNRVRRRQWDRVSMIARIGWEMACSRGRRMSP